MAGVPAKLVTLIVIYQAQTVVQAHLRALGITGYSESSVDGHGETGDRRAGLIDAANIEYKIVTSASLAEKVLEWVERDLARHHPCVAYVVDVVAAPSSRFKSG
jgi:hypothetical protein